MPPICFTHALALARHRPAVPPHTSPRTPSTSRKPRRINLSRLRLHVHLTRAERNHPPDPPSPPSQPTAQRAAPPDDTTPVAQPATAGARRRRVFTDAEKRAHGERMRAKWRDPAWRAAMLERRRESQTALRQSAAAKRLWQDPAFRQRMRAARLGRIACNRGISPSDVTRLRMSVARRGMRLSEETKRKMSIAKLQRPDGDNWPKRISESKKGKTREYFQNRREFRALHRDLKLWSDSYRSKYGQLPKASNYERIVAPMMVFRIRRYLTLRDTIGEDDPGLSSEIISRD